MRTIRAVSASGAVLAAALLAAACSSSAKSGSSSAPAGGAGGTSGSTSSGTSSAAPAGQGVSIETHSGPLGTFLTDGSGHTLYMFGSDSATKSNCSGGCASFWPPLTTTGAPTATGGASAGMITTITRSDGGKQVVYGGHPLYYYKADTAAGDTNGQGSDNFGAKWYVVAPSGQPITGGSSGPSSSSSSAGGGGGGWS